MLKALGKLKTGKPDQSHKRDGLKREKSERQVQALEEKDMHIASKGNRLAVKEKDKPRANKSSKKKKPQDAGSTDVTPQSSDEPIVNTRSSYQSRHGRPHEDHHHHHHHNHDARNKTKRRHTKTCEDTVGNAVQDFFETAWMACAERFFIASAPVTVSYELRNTWLRLVEAEWQDPDMREKPSAKPNRIFRRDQPPLPLAYDSWSRGAIESLPQFRKESVLDPFLRDVDLFGALAQADRLSSFVTSASEGEKSLEDPLIDELYNTKDDKEDIETEMKSESPQGDEVQTEGEKWDFSLDQRLSEIFVPPESSELSVTEGQSTLESVMASEETRVDSTPVRIIVSARYEVPLEESTTEVDESPPNSSDDSLKRQHKRQLKKFSPIQCGGKNHSGIFRLPLETTSEALLKKNAQDQEPDFRSQTSQLEASRTLDQQDIARVGKKGNANSPEELDDEEFEVQPLFEEFQPRGQEAQENTHRHNEIIWLRRSQNDAYFHGDRKAVDVVASDLNANFISRKLLHLHSRFKRQALRALAYQLKHKNEGKKKRGARENRERGLPSPNSTVTSASAASALSKTSMTTGRNQSSKGDSVRKTLTNKQSSNSASSINMSSVHHRSFAKGTFSETQLPSASFRQSQYRQAGTSIAFQKPFIPPFKKNFNFKKIGNVQPANEWDRKTSKGKFQNSMLSSHFENAGQRRGGNQSRCCRDMQKSPSNCASTSTTCSIKCCKP